MLAIGSLELKSRLILGTGKYPSPEIMVKCHEASGTDLVTVAVRRVDLADKTKASFLNWIDRSKIKLVVNRFNADLGLDRDAIQTALNVDVFQVLPEDADTIQKSLLEGKPVASSSAMGKQFVNMAERLGGREKETKKRKPLLSGIFSLFDGVLHKG